MQASVAQTWDVTYTADQRWYVHLLPSLTDLAFLLPVFLLFALLPGAQLLLTDGDTGWHLRTGDWILAHHAIPRADIFSFSKPHQAWFAWEWGWDVIFAAIHRAAGLNGVVLVNILLLGLISALLFRLIRRCSDNDLLAVGITLWAVCATMLHWLARPHLVSWLFLLIFLHVIASAEEGHRRALYALPLLMLVWVNVHGGFVLGIVLLVASAAGQIVDALLGAYQPLRTACLRSFPYLAAALGCLAATLVNPYTWHLHLHVLAYLRDSRLLDNIQEFQSINFHHPSSIFVELMLLGGIAAGFECLRRRDLASGLLILLCAHLALRSERNAPIFVLIAAPSIARFALDAARRLGRVPLLRAAGRTIGEISADLRPLERIERWHLVSVAAVLFIVVSMRDNRAGFEAEFNPNNFPIQHLAAVDQMKGLRVFTSDQWSDYLIYRFYPDQKVFVDGRSDFYGYDLVNTYQHIMSAQYDWESQLKRFAIEAVMVPPEAPLAAVLKQSPRWQVIFDNGSVIIFRATADHPAHDSSSTHKSEERRSV